MKHLIRLMFVVFLFSTLFSSAYANAPMAQTQMSGFYRIHLGKFEVTALYDGSSELGAKLLKNIPEVKLKQLLSNMFVEYPNMQTAVNAYLINTGDHLVLIDTGAGDLLGHSLGNVLQNLNAAGYTTMQVDTVLLTHLHGDHAGGLIDANGNPIFTRAKVFVAKEESDYWLSQQSANKAPEGLKPFFLMAQKIAAPYIANKIWETYNPSTQLVPGIKSVSTFGHTQGHTAYEIESEGQKLLIWGDVVHSHAVQFAQPSVSFEFDTNPRQAIETRLKMMQELTANKSLVAGAHLPFPGIGHIRSEGKGKFRWIPIEFHL